MLCKGLIQMTYRLKKIVEPTIAVWLGAMAPVCAVISIGVSIALSPWFSWSINALSDLGVSEAAPIFNLGLMLTGSLISIFAVALAKVERESRLGLASALGVFVCGASVVGVGVFTEDYMVPHILFAASCFVSMIISSFLLGMRFASNRRTKILIALTLPYLILSIIIGSIVLPSLTFPVSIPDSRLPGMSIIEVLFSLPFIPWYALLCVRLYRKNSTPKT